ncbi:ATP-binding protein [Bacillus carboniphilus]|uniref:ATP-binding protein n=1 Tax=Bacillus carboniphilus TaxID=86663 RepID=A0ABY9JVX6_9BACI|nr:ATP-binding protein [Bacillus carboniphilus]WLR41836.1 ATP-binding protein [Bacillus carboniphilus]
MEKSSVQSVLKAWHTVEALSPSEVKGISESMCEKKFLDQQKRIKTEQVSLSDRPWLEIQLANPEKHRIQFRYYLSCFKQDTLVCYLREVFGNKDEIINKNNQKLFSFSILVDQNGQYIKDSLFVPILMYVLKEVGRSHRGNYENMMEHYQDQLKLFSEQVDASLLNGVTEVALRKVLNVYKEYFFQIDQESLHYVEKEIVKNGQDQGDKNFNSFFLHDLGRIIEKGENETLRQYIEGEQRNKTVINENRELLEDILQPKNLPNGRWPSPIKHRLSLMQQVAVNQIFHMNQKISSVNGPPGTGKTTLLKDIFAELMVERAEKMTCFADPKEAFKHIKTLKLDTYPYAIYEIDESISNYSMVVASSNNGAVENISKDIPVDSPMIKEKDKSEATEYENSYLDYCTKTDLYPTAAKRLLDDESVDAWGLFSAALGKSENISTYYKALYGCAEDKKTFIKQLEEDKKTVELTDWQEAVEDFQKTLRSVEDMKHDLQEFSELYKKEQDLQRELNRIKEEGMLLEEKEIYLKTEINHHEENRRLIKQQLQTLPKQPFFKRLLRKKDEKKIKLEKELYETLERLKRDQKQLHHAKKRLEEKNNKVAKLDVALNFLRGKEKNYRKQNLIIPDDEYWKDNINAYENRQEKTPWVTDQLNYERGLLFLKAMNIHKLIMIFNDQAIKSSIRLINFRNKLDLNQREHRTYLENAWKTIHLVTPLVSTTFASFRSMYKGIDQDFIDYLFIDEAGQATPQQAAGAMWRSKRAIVVGDPIQIEPVVTIDQTILADVKRHFQIHDRYIDIGSSVQSLADHANPFGMYTKDGQWIGIPLWVHRRCQDPMFTISNEIAYDNNMVLALKKKGKSSWFDCKGTAVNLQFVEEQAYLVAEKITYQWKLQSKPPSLYVITPFTAVKEGLRKIVKSHLVSEGVLDKTAQSWVNKNIGTVHTFQGKEADIVYFVVGTDENKDSAADWSCSKPNLINVAVTRAKKEFYIVGDYDRLSKKEYYQTIAEHVEKVELKLLELIIFNSSRKEKT